jgi:hypothetical protein
MTDDQKDEEEGQLNQKPSNNDDDLQFYLKEIEILESDFSDLDDLDFEEIQEMQEAIAKVKESEESTIDAEVISEIESERREDLINDFSDIDEIDFDELKEMQQAIESVKQEELVNLEGQESVIQTSQEISKELEDRIKKELSKRKEVEEEVITPERFSEYVKNKRDKIWYHALYFLVFEVEDHIASKALLYDVLKEVTSKSPIDPIQEHRFYFGLGYILRLTLNAKKIIRYMTGGKFKINVNVDNLKTILEDVGEPISTKPIIEEKEKKKMFDNFLKDDFSDI